METSVPSYAIYYRSNKVFCRRSQWYFEDDNGEAFGPFDDKQQTLKAVRIYRDIRQKGVQLPMEKLQKVL